MSQKKIVEFFNTHPEAEEVHVALGVLFIEKEKAEAFLGGTSEKVKTVLRDTETIQLTGTTPNEEMSFDADKAVDILENMGQAEAGQEETPAPAEDQAPEATETFTEPTDTAPDSTTEAPAPKAKAGKKK